LFQEINRRINQHHWNDYLMINMMMLNKLYDDDVLQIFSIQKKTHQSIDINVFFFFA
jgi:hypothetical protein